ncbi:rhodanese-like domain-containing protein [Marinomonas ostreistagni]|uniref:Rhodanese-like domain-containing protein n=1 Tax=Marinomonas ostreistagni TaxID=359209 RepID=A0ABS0Z7X2_9GAMM|nr:rhodanese-like domain-containing protein [Marinomonas ostreistagni]MBJ7549742.1 rhodanese-like domain-containing protein [Marinomonas ostreistagni]
MERLAVDTQTPFKHMLLILLAAIIAIFSINALASKRSDLAWQALEQGAVLIDVRTAAEFREGHIDSAVNMPLSSLSKLANPIDRDKTIVVYCRSGSRASHAKRQLYDMGFTHVLNGGGLEEMKSTKP